ncbi:MAG: carboxyl transferase domain-containing protein [Spirochaetia bacterium]
MEVLSCSARIGIVNRGESAYRFIRAVREYNLLYDKSLSSVAFYTEKEKEALFAQEADDAYALSSFSAFKDLKGPAYLDHELLIQALIQSQCDAVWVGWGFVSEDSEFVKKVEDAGLIFLGPSSHVMHLVGDKISSKELAERSGTPICPWSGGPVPSLDEAYKVAEKIGYPCVVKASNAGGGRGIRFVFNKNELAQQYQSAVDETLRVTGNTVVFMERLVEEGRHLEVQALADMHGCVKTFGVRDCSVQRKNQKIIEETPPAHLDATVLAGIEASAQSLLQEAQYRGAGTVEFLYDIKRHEYYFMEVNARLQVEHPITEQLYGVDLAAGQIAVAFGAHIDDYNTVPQGHVMEVRLNAEDPENGFRPAGGFVRYFRAPGGMGVRVDSGIQSGSFIPPDFDSMVAKIIVTARTRDEARARLYRAVKETRVDIVGGATNRTFLLELLQMQDIKDGGVSTRFVETYLETRPHPTKHALQALLVAAAEIYLSREEELEQVFHQQMIFNGYSRALPASFGQEVNIKYAGVGYEMLVHRLSDKKYCVRVGDKKLYFEYIRGVKNTLGFSGNLHYVSISGSGNQVRVEIDHVPYLLESDAGGMIKAPSPGLVLQVKVKTGQSIQEGDVLLTLEAMKTELPLLATEAGVVGEILVKSGEQVGSGQTLIRLEKQHGGTAKPKAHADAGIFAAYQDDSKDHIKDELLALTTGYDFYDTGDIASLCRQMTQSQPIISAINHYINFVKIFSHDSFSMGGYAGALSSLQLMINYYRSYERLEKDFPQEFLDNLRGAFLYFSCDLGVGKLQDHALYRCYRFYVGMQNVTQYIGSMLLTIEHFKDWQDEDLLLLLDSVATYVPTLRSISGNVRYQLVDQPLREALASLRLDKQAHNIELLKKGGENRKLLLAKAVSYGRQSEPYLVERILKHDDAALCLEVLSHRMYRDCLISDWQSDIEGKRVHLTYVDHEGKEKIAYIVVAETFKEGVALFADIKNNVGILFCKEKVGLTDLEKSRIGLSRICIGHLNEKTILYSNFIFENQTWQLDPDRTFISPLFYRELRIYRLQEFTKTYQHLAPGLVLAHAHHHKEEKDERLILFISVEVVNPVVNEQQQLTKLVGFEDRLLSGMAALQEAQAKHKRALRWNRIIVFIRPRLSASWEQITEYAQHMIGKYLNRELGLEHISVYLRDKHEQYHELIISQLSGGAIHTHHRPARTEALVQLNEYTHRISLSKSRGLFYPYELINNLEEGRFNLPQAKFEEFDLCDENSEEAKSVAGRPYAQNQGNIVFGILEMPLNGIACRRVAIFSDPSSDMGSLAEAECRRVNAALDLAQKERLPAEWVTTSSGARINLTSGTENLDWTARTLRKIIEYTQAGGELNIIVAGTNVGAQSYWNSEATMLMHCRGLLIMTADASMLLTGKKALDFSGSVSAENNLGIGGAHTIMLPNGEAQIYAQDLEEAYEYLWQYYTLSYARVGELVPAVTTKDSPSRNVGKTAYQDDLGQGFLKIADIFSTKLNGERKKSFDMRQVMRAVIDTDCQPLERWSHMQHAETAIVWHARIGGVACGLLGIESRSLIRHGYTSFDGPGNFSGGTLYPQSSKKVARAINSFSGKVPLVVLANLSGFDGSPESLRKNQLEWGAEIGRAVVNFDGPILFVVVSRYHGGAYVVFSKALNPNLKSIALEGSFASVIGGAPAAAVVFPGQVKKETYQDSRMIDAQEKLKIRKMSRTDFNALYRDVYSEKQNQMAQSFDRIHSVQRAQSVGSIDEIVSIDHLRSAIIQFIKPKK